MMTRKVYTKYLRGSSWGQGTVSKTIPTHQRNLLEEVTLNLRPENKEEGSQ